MHFKIFQLKISCKCRCFMCGIFLRWVTLSQYLKWALVNSLTCFISWCSVFEICSSVFQHVSCIWISQRVSKPAVSETGVWVLGRGGSPIWQNCIQTDRFGLDFCMCWYTCFCSRESVFWYLMNYYWVKGLTGVLPWPTGKVGDVCLLCLWWPPPPSTISCRTGQSF